MTTPSTARLTLVSSPEQVTYVDSEVALGVIATVKGGAPVENLRVEWRIASGTGVLVSPSAGPVVTRTNSNGLTSVNFRPSAPDWTSITAAISGHPETEITFRIRAIASSEPIAPVPEVLIVFGAEHDCYAVPDPRDPTLFPSNPLVVRVGDNVGWVYHPSMHPLCTARIVSTLVPPGGNPIDTGVLSPGHKHLWVPNVEGDYIIQDVINGGSATLKVVSR
ncbi:MAG: hypothetical protein ACR2GK_12240 [Gemmatimonadaceae bacterium]